MVTKFRLSGMAFIRNWTYFRIGTPLQEGGESHHVYGSSYLHQKFARSSGDPTCNRNPMDYHGQG
jgi:hypothetical protein